MRTSLALKARYIASTNFENLRIVVMDDKRCGDIWKSIVVDVQKCARMNLLIIILVLERDAVPLTFAMKVNEK